MVKKDGIKKKFFQGLLKHAAATTATRNLIRILTSMRILKYYYNITGKGLSITLNTSDLRLSYETISYEDLG